MPDSPPTAPQELSCEECRELLCDFADGELAPEHQQPVRQHLKTCQRCASESTQIHGLKELLQGWQGIQGRDEWRKSVMDQFIRESSVMSARPFREAAEKAREEAEEAKQGRAREEAAASGHLSPFWVFALALLLALLAFFLMRHWGGS